MAQADQKFRFLLIQAFHLSGNTKYQLRPMQGDKESMLMNYRDFAPLLADVACALVRFAWRRVFSQPPHEFLD